MRKFSFAIISFILINILPAVTFAATNDKQIDMDLYANFAAYGFFIILALFFSFFLYSSSHHFDEPGKINSYHTVTVVTDSISRDMAASINIIYYSVISLIVISIISFVLLIH